jgi:hypothetical protein
MSTHTCRPCPVCYGRGTYYIDSFGQARPFVSEDTDQSESCDYCEGTGRVGRCQRCDELAMEEEDAAYGQQNRH